MRTSSAFSVETADYVRCRACRSLFDSSPPGVEALRRIYAGSDYFSKPDNGGSGETLWGYPADYVADRDNIERKFDGVLAHVERYAPIGRLLDLGCGPGFLLTVAGERGWEAVGLDLNEWAVDQARELGFEARVGELSGAGFDDASFDAMTMMDLIEHVPDPDSLLDEAARVVRPGGALAILTPDAGSPISRMLGRRWPEVARPGEHTVLFSVEGLTAALARHGFAAAGWHSIGKEAALTTLAADIAPAAPGASAIFRRWADRGGFGQRTVDFDPRTKFCLYARRLETQRPPGHAPARVPKRAEELASVEAAIVSELESLAGAEGFCDWMYDQFADHVGGLVVEVGAGIGTFSRRLLDGGAERLVAIEPDEAIADELERRLGADVRVELSRDALPGSPALKARAGEVDLVVCQNVLEHIGDDEAALAAMAAALKPGGWLALVVPAGPRLFGPLDDAYGHWRRYEEPDLEATVAGAGLEVEELRHMNTLGVPGWWVKNRRPGARIGSGSLRAYEAILSAWRPIEDRLAPSSGLSIFCLARVPELTG